ncbi:hypothetical protein L1987_07183 [Smallanthus sonchifolius]|uniref:Uncharacterized protein n=1 Tax=Smallanthus sonchifolius TaxID=185202 RepID=A0ACB9K081_9ASTR|nr:hypothetical protein L1987_07183 [Smallanthus sonchifolius]
MSSANPEPAPLHPVVSDGEDVQEEPDQVSESEPEEESEEEPVGGAEGANSSTDSGETVPYSVMHGENTSSEEVRPPTPYPPWSPNPVPLLSEWVNFMDLRVVRPQEVGPTEPTIPPSTERSETQPDLGAQQSEDTSEDSDAIIEAVDDRLVQLQGMVDLNDSALGRLHGRVTTGETLLTVVEQEAVAAGQREARIGERLDSFAALTIVNTMLLAFVLFRGWFF